MARKDSILGSSGAGSNEPAPWEAGTQAQPVSAPVAGETDDAQSTTTPEEQTRQDMERDLAGVVRPAQQGQALSREEALERLDRARQDSRPAVVMGPFVQALSAKLVEYARAEDGESVQVFEDIAKRIEEAQTAADVLADDSPLDAEDVIGVPLQIWGASVNESDFKDGLPTYVALRAIRLDTQEDIVVTCGAFKVVAKAFKLMRMKAFPVQAQITKSERKTSNGYDVLNLVALR